MNQQEAQDDLSVNDESLNAIVVGTGRLSDIIVAHTLETERYE